jgi:hypothetical protein
MLLLVALAPSYPAHKSWDQEVGARRESYVKEGSGLNMFILSCIVWQ